MNKYKQIEIVSCNDEGYLSYRQAFINIKRAKRPVEYTPQLPTSMHCVAKTVEHLVRSYFFGSDNRRILKYDVLFKGCYLTQYLELDILKFESNGDITVGEIKASHRAEPFRCVKQLRRSKEILSYLTNVNAFAIVVDMTQNNPTGNISAPKIETHLEGFCFRSVSLSLGDIYELTSNHNVEIDVNLFEKAYEEAVASRYHRTEKLQHKLAKKIETAEQQLQESGTISAFGILLKQALTKKQSHTYTI